jgi:hypothetical protein
VKRESCDTIAGADRLCWSTKPGIAGYRCGDDKDLDVTGGFTRHVFHAP